ncbi:MAG TPA: hypothetical protein VK622_05460 [Puia sp.]|nr:hypothetical protein [Puia sp.]
MVFKRILPGIFLLYMFSCSKNSTITPNTPPTPVVPVVNCKITNASVVSGTGVTIGNYSYQYNSDGTLAGSLYAAGIYSDTVSYKYNGKLIYRSVAAGINSSVDTITLNDAGMEALDKAQIGASVYLTTYSYDANGLLKTFTQQQDAYPPISASYTFTDGDNTLTTNGADADTLVYDVNKTAVMGNMDQFNQLLSFGAMYIKNKHLIKEEHHGAAVYFTYTYTPEGNIATAKIVVGNNSQTISYTYDCK